MTKEQIKQKAEEWMRNNSERCTKENMNGYDFAIATCIAVTTEATKELEKENAELKKDNEGYEKDNTLLVNRFNQTSAKLTKAKEIISEYIRLANLEKEDTVAIWQLYHKAEQFISEVEK